jgi:hypothetical protein
MANTVLNAPYRPRTFEDEFVVYDKLPPSHRLALQLSLDNWDARAVRDRITTHGRKSALTGLLDANDRLDADAVKAHGVRYLGRDKLEALRHQKGK